MNGNTGKILYIDLSNQIITEEHLPEEIYVQYLGGYGLGVKFIYERLMAGVDPLGPENILGFTTGVLVGTPTISGNCFTVCGKSPLTNTWGDSNCSGYFGTALKRSGFDAVFFVGMAEDPAYLLLENDRAELRNAWSLWGKNVTETQTILQERHGEDAKVACIGPAGENLSLIAVVMHDEGRVAGGLGLGAVMGSKNLKAIVAVGNQEVPVADLQGAKELCIKWTKDLLARPSAQKFREYGTIDHVASSIFSNDAPVKNWAGVGIRDFPQATSISDDNILKYEQKKYACWQCPLVCGGIYSVESGPYKVSRVHKPEYETCCMFGSNLLNDNLESIIYLNDLCNRLGIDTISMGATIGFAIECFEKGFVNEEDTGGIVLKWGDHEAIVKAARAIGLKEGKLGQLFGDGAKMAAERIGKNSIEFAIQIQGQELAAHDPRFGVSWATYYKVDATPGRHTQIGIVPYENGGGIPGLDVGKVQKYEYTGKGEITARLQNIYHALYSAGICMQVILRCEINSWPEFLHTVTGREYSLNTLEKIGARIAALRQAFNIREGLPVTSFKLPGRAYGNPPLDEGPLKGITLDVDSLTKEYYEAQGWDPSTGKPTYEKLINLGLGDIAYDIYGK